MTSAKRVTKKTVTGLLPLRKTGWTAEPATQSIPLADLDVILEQQRLQYLFHDWIPMWCERESMRWDMTYIVNGLANKRIIQDPDSENGKSKMSRNDNLNGPRKRIVNMEPPLPTSKHCNQTDHDKDVLYVKLGSPAEEGSTANCEAMSPGKSQGAVKRKWQCSRHQMVLKVICIMKFRVSHFSKAQKWRESGSLPTTCYAIMLLLDVYVMTWNFVLWRSLVALGWEKPPGIGEYSARLPKLLTVFSQCADDREWWKSTVNLNFWRGLVKTKLSWFTFRYFEGLPRTIQA